MSRRLKYLLKVPDFILDYSNVAGFLTLYTLCLGRSKTLPYVRKKYDKNKRHLCLVWHKFTKLSQNACLINTHILIYRQYSRYDCKLWNDPWFYCVFLAIFINNWRAFMSEVQISLPNFLRLCVWIIYTLWYVNMPNVTAGYGRISDSIAFLENIS